MHLKLTDTVAGVPARTARDVFRLMGRDTGRPLSFFIGRLAEGKAETRKLLDQLTAEGYLTVEADTQDGKTKHWWETTEAALGVANANFSRRLKRKTADRLLAEVITRVREANANPDFIYQFDRVAVFGSYLDDTGDLGDLDIATERSLKPGWTQEKLVKEIRRLRLNPLDGWAKLRNAPGLYVKARNGYISLHTLEEIEKMGIRHRIIYPEPGV